MGAALYGLQKKKKKRQEEQGLLPHFTDKEKNLKLWVELSVAYSSVPGTNLSTSHGLAHLIFTTAHEVGTIIISTL